MWRELRAGGPLPASEPEPAQYVAIPASDEQPVPFEADAIAAVTL